MVDNFTELLDYIRLKEEVPLFITTFTVDKVKSENMLSDRKQSCETFSMMSESLVSTSWWSVRMMRTCESYRERRKTCEPLTALTVVITEKFIGNGESEGNAHIFIISMTKYIHTHNLLYTLSNKPTQSYIKPLPGKSCLVGALSWIFLSILKERSVSSRPSLLVHSPDSNDTPSMSSDRSRTFRTSIGSAAKRQETVWLRGLGGWSIYLYISACSCVWQLNPPSFSAAAEFPAPHSEKAFNQRCFGRSSVPTRAL